MPNDAYDRLDFLDHSFLLAESPTQHMHVGDVGMFRELTRAALPAEVTSRTAAS